MLVFVSIRRRHTICALVTGVLTFALPIFNALVAILPWNRQAQRRTVLIRQDLAVHADRHERERMHRLVDAQPLNVWPVEHAKARIRHLLAIVKRLEGDIPGLRCWLEALEKRAEREAIRSEEHTSELQSLMR